MKDKDKDFKDSLFEAIDDHPAYSKIQKEILKIIIGISVNRVATIAVKTLVEKLNSSKATIYFNLKALKKDGLIISQNEEKEKFTTFRLNQVKADEMLYAYSIKKNFLN